MSTYSFTGKYPGEYAIVDYNDLLLIITFNGMNWNVTSVPMSD